jgi:hypothetical protein
MGRGPNPSHKEQRPGVYRGTPEFSATERRLRGYAEPAQTIDAHITEDGGPVRYYAKLPKTPESPEA